MVDLRREGISPAQLSRCFSLNRSTSHRWEKSPPNQTLMSLQETLLSVFEASSETYGSRRLSQAVTDLGIKIGRFKARRLMRELEIKAKCPKAKVWRKQAVDFAENSANGQCAMMPDTIWAELSAGRYRIRRTAAYAFKPCDLPFTAASPLRTLFSTQTAAPNTAAKPFGMC